MNEQFKTYEQLMQHYWGVIVPMAESAGINPWECVRFQGKNNFWGEKHPNFYGMPNSYTFALTVLEGRPVWEGDDIFSKETGMKIKVMAHHAERYLKWESMTWTPPTKKSTFMLGGKELPCPLKSEPCADNLNYATLCNDGHEFYFESCEDKTAWRRAITYFLIAARDKE